MRGGNLGLANTDGMKPVSWKSRRVALMGLLACLSGIGVAGGSASSRVDMAVFGSTWGLEGTGGVGFAEGRLEDTDCGFGTGCDESCGLETTEAGREGVDFGTVC